MANRFNTSFRSSQLTTMKDLNERFNFYIYVAEVVLCCIGFIYAQTKGPR